MRNSDSSRFQPEVEVELVFDISALSQNLFGKPRSHRAIAGLVGALDVADITVMPNDSHSLLIETSHPCYAASRVVARGADGRLVMKNENLRKNPRNPDAPPRLGAMLLARQIPHLQAHRIATIDVQAAGIAEYTGSGGMNGYYTWSSMGVNGRMPLHPHELPAAFAHATTMHDFFALPGAAAWWKANGVSFDATFSTRPHSEHMRRFAKYLGRHRVEVYPERLIA